MELEGREFEASLLHHAHGKGIELGIPTLVHSGEIKMRGRSGRQRIDSTSLNRRLDEISKSKKDRVHFRLVMTPNGRPLFEFHSQREFLIAYRDAIQGKD
jgi:hypothetical protein